MKIHINNLNKFFNRLYLIGFIVLSIGIPLAFSSLTRSVFEVNKLLILRLVIIFIYGAWIVKSCLLKDNNFMFEKNQCFELFGFRWRRIGLEIPVLLLIITNLISIALSKNIFIGYIGAYDRWESLATVANYILLFYMSAKLIDNTKYRILIFCICLFSTSISSIYGIIQSLGIDFMNWSKSPTSRVFACINNPVHFCAYVAMIVPIGISLMFYKLRNLYEKSVDFIHTKLNIYSTFTAFIALLVIPITFPSIMSLVYLQFLLFILLGSYILYHYISIIPTKKNAVQMIAFIALFILCNVFDLYFLNRFQTTALAFSLLSFFCLSAWGNKSLFMYRLISAATILVFYSMILSFSRATLVGFSISISFFFQCILQRKENIFSLPKLICLLSATSLICLLLIFKLYTFGLPGIIISIGVMLCGFLLMLYSSATATTLTTLFSNTRDTLLHFIFFILIYVLFLNFSIITDHLLLFLIPLLILFNLKGHKLNESFIKNNLCIAIILNAAFFFISVSYLVIHCILLLYFNVHYLKKYLTKDQQVNTLFIFVSFLIFTTLPIYIKLIQSFTQNTFNFLELTQQINFFSFIGLFGLLLVFNTRLKLKKAIIYLIVITFILFNGTLILNKTMTYSSLAVSKSDSLQVANSITKKMKSVSNNNARFYMWLSVPPWVLDYPLFGSGPDTTRALYPTYRHPDYGHYEGGHNYTPDRLHNEYLNTLVTKGIIGFVIKYIFFYGGWILIMFQLLKKYQSDTKFYIIAGIFAGPIIYLAQVLFNFGVVATLFLFYFLLGIGLSFINDEYEYNNEA